MIKSSQNTTKISFCFVLGFGTKRTIQVACYVRDFPAFTGGGRPKVLGLILFQAFLLARTRVEPPMFRKLARYKKKCWPTNKLKHFKL